MANERAAVSEGRMTAERFAAWAGERRGGPRHELVDGTPVAMAPERARHALVKVDAVVALREGVRRAGLDCTVFGDGMTVVVGEHEAYEPDAAVQCGGWDEDDVALDSPVILVEVLSPSTGQLDTSGKLAGYLSLPSVAHYLIVDPRPPGHHPPRAGVRAGRDRHAPGARGRAEPRPARADDRRVRLLRLVAGAVSVRPAAAPHPPDRSPEREPGRAMQ